MGLMMSIYSLHHDQHHVIHLAKKICTEVTEVLVWIMMIQMMVGVVKKCKNHDVWYHVARETYQLIPV